MGRKKKSKFDFAPPEEKKIPELPIVETKISDRLTKESKKAFNKICIRNAWALTAELGHQAFGSLPEGIKKDLCLKLLMSNKNGNPRDTKKCIKIFTNALLNAAKEYTYLTMRRYYKQNESNENED